MNTIMLSKTLQRRLYSVLSDRTNFLTIIIVLGMTTVSIFHFGEAWLEWSADKYAAVFNSFSDNLVGKSLQGRLCQYVPIDVVYTWVNGSDPMFLDELKHAKERLRATKGRVLLKGCPYDDCVPSHMLSLDHVLPANAKLDSIRNQNSHLHSVVGMNIPELACGNYIQNRTTLLMGSVDSAVRAHNQSASLIYGWDKHRIHLTHWTTDWTVPNSFQMGGFCIMSNLPHGATENKVKNILPAELRGTVTQFWLYDDQQLAVLESRNVTLMRAFLDENSELELGAGTKVRVTPASLIVQLPKYADDETFGSNRYADYEQLRYSIRSLEKYAPWVRKIFLVTNGQIPYWLNMDHPKLTVVTHEEIFDETEDLPTFSSPAIEANLHNIPDISEKFLYFNDDVMLGRAVWPEDFYSEYSGHKIRLSWPLPDCSPGCPTSWVHDGYCDKACNVTECSFDGGDCLGENPRMGFGDMDQDHAFNWQEDEMSERPYCANTCMDNWLADSFCDDMCNHPECGFDAGDCGMTRFHHLHKVSFKYNSTVPAWKFQLPVGCTVAYWNMTAMYSEFDEVGLVPMEHRDVRSISLSDAHQIMTVVLYANVSSAVLNMTVQAKNNETVVIHHFLISSNTTGHIAMDDPPPEDELIKADDLQLPPEIEEALGDDLANMHFEKVNETYLNITDVDLQHLAIVQHQLDNEEITRKGFNVRRNKVLQVYIRRYLVAGGSLKDILPRNVSFEEIDSVQHRALLSLDDDVAAFEEDAAQARPPQRRLLDAFGESLLHVNRIYSDLYGHEARKVPAHMPIFVDTKVLTELRSKFPDEWDETSSHTFRESEDFQFSFAYAHFVLNEKLDFNSDEVFNEFDTDGSGTWSDREIRTLLTRMHHLPLYLETVREFESRILNCSGELPKSLSNVDAPAYERYYDSKLPVVSRGLIGACSSVQEVLEKHFKDRKKFRHETVDDNQVAMKRLTSNVSHVVRELDDLRRNPVKFICINDDTDPNRIDDNKFVQSVLIDFFESVLPVPSSFELPTEYRNKFTHVGELVQWQFYRNLLHYATVFSFVGLAFMLLTSYLGIDVNKWLEDHVFRYMPGVHLPKTEEEKRDFSV